MRFFKNLAIVPAVIYTSGVLVGCGSTTTTLAPVTTAEPKIVIDPTSAPAPAPAPSDDPKPDVIPAIKSNDVSKPVFRRHEKPLLSGPGEVTPGWNGRAPKPAVVAPKKDKKEPTFGGLVKRTRGPARILRVVPPTSTVGVPSRFLELNPEGKLVIKEGSLGHVYRRAYLLDQIMAPLVGPVPTWVNHAERVLNFYLSHAVARGLVDMASLAANLDTPAFKKAMKGLKAMWNRKDADLVTAGEASALVSAMAAIIPGLDTIAAPGAMEAFLASLNVEVGPGELDGEVRVILGRQGEVISAVYIPGAHIEGADVVFAGVSDSMVLVLNILAELPEWSAVLDTREADLIISALRLFHAQSRLIKKDTDGSVTAAVIETGLKFITGTPVEELVLPETLMNLDDAFSRVRELAMSADETEIHHIVVLPALKGASNEIVLAYDKDGNLLENMAVNLPNRIPSKKVSTVPFYNRFSPLEDDEESDEEESD
jgi:hypothetical protein